MGKKLPTDPSSPLPFPSSPDSFKKLKNCFFNSLKWEDLALLVQLNELSLCGV